jgi:hydrogenase nickel incorporation protein HypA/HybF
MHEVGLMRDALDIALEHAARQRATRIDVLTMRVGDAAAIDSESLRLAFDIVTRGTIAEGAQLAVERVAALGYCPRCDLEFTPADTPFACPQCRRTAVEVRGGQSLELGPIEMSRN